MRVPNYDFDSTDEEVIVDRNNDNVFSDDSFKDDFKDNPQERQEVEIEVEIPNMTCNLGNLLYITKLPNILSVENRRFDSAYFEDETEEDESKLKLKVENVIRWRYKTDRRGEIVRNPNTGDPVKESNTRVVRWSDGSLTLHLGDEVFDMSCVNVDSEFSHLFIRQGTGLLAQAVIERKLLFTPVSTESRTHRKMAMSVAACQFSKRQKVKFISTIDENPEINRMEMVKKEEEKNRAEAKLENSQRRSRNRLLPSHSFSIPEGSVRDGYESEYSHTSRRRKCNNWIDDHESSDDDSDSSGFGQKTNKRKVINSDDD